ncbi:MAG: MFS transporter [Nostocoides sp.]
MPPAAASPQPDPTSSSTRPQLANPHHGKQAVRLLIPASTLTWGLQFSFLNPSVGLLLVVLYGATAREVGWALAAYNLSGFVSTLIIPSRADRSGDYIRPLLWCGVLTVSLTIALALAPTLGWAAVALVLLGGPAGVAMGLIFAHLRAIGAPVNSVMRTRAVFSFAWAIGPPVATVLIGWFGNQSVLWAVAGIAVVGMGLSVLLRQAHARSGRDGGSNPPPHFLPCPSSSFLLLLLILRIFLYMFPILLSSNILFFSLLSVTHFLTFTFHSLLTQSLSSLQTRLYSNMKYSYVGHVVRSHPPLQQASCRGT